MQWVETAGTMFAETYKDVFDGFHMSLCHNINKCSIYATSILFNKNEFW